MNNKKPKRGMSYLLSIDDSLGTNAVRVPRAHVAPEAVNFYITQDTQKHILAPVLRSGGFRITGRVATRCALSEPITGELTVDSSTVPIRSIDLQLLRVESVNAGEKMATETSEIQSTQARYSYPCPLNLISLLSAR
jgi:hypothetical protein